MGFGLLRVTSDADAARTDGLRRVDIPFHSIGASVYVADPADGDTSTSSRRIAFWDTVL
jgi:hypothetical protein